MRTSPPAAVASLAAVLALLGCGATSPNDPGWTAPTVVVTAGDTENFIAWSGGTSPTCVNIYWSTTPGVTPATGNRVPGWCTGYRHTGLSNGVSYHYVVAALVAGSEGWISQEFVATPSGPTQVAAVPGPGPGQITVTWDPVQGASGYSLYWISTPLSQLASMARVTGAVSPYVLANLGVNACYIRVSATVGGVETPASPELEAMPGAL